jgi:small GTP-binding protein
MALIKKKITMLGAFAVGKTSLVQRYVNSIFSEKYQTTIGVKIDQKMVEVGDTSVMLMLWDLYGEDDYLKVKPTYLAGSSGYLLVADGTRANTIDVALQLQEMAAAYTNNAPFILIINKFDLATSWEVKEKTINLLREKGWHIIITSAKENHMVDEAFGELANMMINNI